MADPVIANETVGAVRDNAGTLAGLATAAIAAIWGMWKVMPRINSELNSAAKASTVQLEMLTTLRQERDAALDKLEKLRDKYEILFRDWSDLNARQMAMAGKIESMAHELQEANALIANLRGHVKNASRIIDSAPAAKPPEGESNANPD